MEVCDNCKNRLFGNSKIVVRFYGSEGELIKKVLGRREFIFCSTKCFEDFFRMHKKTSEQKDWR